MNPHNRQLFIILVHCGSREETVQAVAALWRGSFTPTAVVVVDHGDTPLGRLPSSQVIRPATNSGFGAGVNIGLGALLAQEAKGHDTVVVMNNDVTVLPDTLGNLQEWWEKNPAPALVGVQVEERGQTVQGGGRLNHWTGRATLITDYGLRITNYDLDYIHGAFFAAPYETLLTLHGLPEEYFLYWEDVLLGKRARARGVPLAVAPGVRVRHLDTAAAPSATKLYYLVRNGALFMAQETGVPWKLWWRFFNRGRVLYHRQRAGKNSATIVQALRDAINQKSGPRPPVHTGSVQTSAVVVSYNSSRWLPQVLSSLAANGVNDVVVVDNASSDNSRQVAQRHGARVIALSKNLGYAAACNRGVAATSTPFVLLLNPDARLSPGSVARVQTYLREHPRVGVVGFRLQDEEGRVEQRSFGPPVTWWSVITRHLLTHPRGGLGERRNLVRQPRRVGWVSAGALLVRREAFEVLKGFDEGFFLYWEDVDFCQRLRAAGWEVVHDPGAVVVHHRGASLQDAAVKTALYDASADRYFQKHYAAMICWLLKSLRWAYRWFSPLAP